MVSPNNGLNLYQGATAVRPGDYSTGVPQDVTAFNQVMMRLAEHFDPFIQQALISQPRFWYSVIPRGSHPNFSGYVHETRIFRGGLQHYAGLGDWAQINPVPSATNNPSVQGGFTTPEYAWERLEWTGFTRRWGSDPISLKSLQYVDQAEQQLQWILQVGADYGISLQEVWNRDYLIKMAVDHNRAYIMNSEYTGASGSPLFYYNAFAKFGTGAGEINPDTGITGPFIVFKQGVEVEPLNFDVLDSVHADLDVSCPGSAMSTQAGENVFGLPISKWDFERYLKSSDWATQNWRWGEPKPLVEGLQMGIKNHRGWGMSFDENQLRFKIVRYVTDYASAKYGGTASDLDGENVVIAQYVPPRIAGRLGENGQYIPTFNPEYNKAQLAVVPALQRDVFTNLMGTEITSLGSGTYFGPQAGLNGVWKWINVLDKDTNPEGLTGNFLGRFEIFPKPDPCSVYATALLYRRCTESIKMQAPVDNTNINAYAADGAITALSYTASGARVADESLNITAKLVKTLKKAGPGMAVKLTFAGVASAVVELSGFISNPSGAPTYVVGLTNVTGLSATEPANGTAGYWIDANGALNQKIVDGNAKAVMTLTSATMV